MCTGIEIAGLIGAAASLASAGAGIAGSAGAFGGPSSPKIPSLPQQDTSQMAKALLPGTTANAAAGTGGGISPDFLSNLVGQNVGVPDAGMGIIDDIQKSLGQR